MFDTVTQFVIINHLLLSSTFKSLNKKEFVGIFKKFQEKIE